jgi:hypothetical protein
VVPDVLQVSCETSMIKELGPDASDITLYWTDSSLRYFEVTEQLGWQQVTDSLSTAGLLSCKTMSQGRLIILPKLSC